MSGNVLNDISGIPVLDQEEDSFLSGTESSKFVLEALRGKADTLDKKIEKPQTTSSAKNTQNKATRDRLKGVFGYLSNPYVIFLGMMIISK